jgi:hypothetical protein
MNWKNNRKLTDPKEFEKVKTAYVVPRFTSELSNAELMDMQEARDRIKVNQAR